MSRGGQNTGVYDQIHPWDWEIFLLDQISWAKAILTSSLYDPLDFHHIDWSAFYICQPLRFIRKVLYYSCNFLSFSVSLIHVLKVFQPIYVHKFFFNYSNIFINFLKPQLALPHELLLISSEKNENPTWQCKKVCPQEYEQHLQLFVGWFFFQSGHTIKT